MIQNRGHAPNYLEGRFRRGRAFSILLGFLFCSAVLPAEPIHVYLTWQGDTSKTITVNYQTKENNADSTVYYDTASRGGAVKDYRHLAKGTSHQIEGLVDGRSIHHVELTRLKPGAVYYFIAGDAEHGFSAEKRLQTIPAGHEPLTFIDGGDMGTGEGPRQLMSVAARQNPAFGLIGGDLAYANGDLKNVGLWDDWLTSWEELMVAPDGGMIPMVLAIGNHETNSKTGPPSEKAPFYFGYFAQEKDRTYFSRLFGKDVVIFALDTGHVVPHGGAQAEWLARELAKHEGAKYRFASYHVPLYPSFRKFEDSPSAKGRENWLPIFDKYHLTAAFEHHDHTFKRTKLLKENQVDASGTLYLGDGCFGKGARSPVDATRWYLEKASSTPHFWRVEVTAAGVSYTAINDKGQAFDSYTETSAVERPESSLLDRLLFWRKRK